MLYKVAKLLGIGTIVSAAALSSAFAQDGGLKIGMSFQTLNNPYFVSMQEALTEASKSVGAKELIITDAGLDVAKQISDIEDMVQRGINILVVNPADTNGIQSAIETAHSAGVVIVAVDANAAGPVDSFVGSKNTDAGYKSCKYLAEALGGKGDVAIIDGIAVVPILERVAGCKKALEEHPEMKLVDVQNAKADRAAALSITENMIQAHPDLKGIFSVMDGAAMGALGAIEASGKEIKLTSVDGAPEAVEAIKRGGAFIETTAQFPRDQIRIGLGMALAKFWGAKVVPTEVPVDVMVVDAANAADFSW
ncbi:MAG: ABC transporter substrate-binding protein [Rhizobiaceae bacterium]|nr:ABC transporter substrate-binding protein [Rhizobiaceae bacterium]